MRRPPPSTSATPTRREDNPAGTCAPARPAQRSAETIGSARQTSPVSSIRRLPGRTAHERGVAQGAESTGSLARAPTSVPGGGGILACSPHDRGHACRGARGHSSEKPRARAPRSNPGARWSAACHRPVTCAARLRAQLRPRALAHGVGPRRDGDPIVGYSDGEQRDAPSGHHRARAASADGEPWPGRARHNNQPTNRRVRRWWWVPLAFGLSFGQSRGSC